MRESVRSIEAISLCFTAGVVTGTVLFPGTGILLPALLLPVLALPCLFRSRLLGAPEPVSAGIILLTFLLAGIFAARSAALPAASTIGPIERLADGAAQSLRSVIGSLPFPSGETAPLLSAFLTGDRSGLTPQLTALFRDSGASHLLALSGLHMGILYLVFDALTKPLGHTPEARRLRFVLLTAGTGFFTLMTGAGPSVVRAFLFITISETLRLKQRPRSSARVYCMALLIQLVLDPAVIGSLGFSCRTSPWPASSLSTPSWNGGIRKEAGTTPSGGCGTRQPSASAASSPPRPSCGCVSTPSPACFS